MTQLRLRRFGGSRQAEIATLADLAQAVDLPEALWATTSCPVSGLRCDQQLLKELDRDSDGRIHADDLRKAVHWMVSMVSEPQRVVPGPGEIKLTDFSNAAAKLKDSAEVVLNNLSAENRELITLAQVRSSDAILESGGHNGDGVIPQSDMTDERLAAAVATILAVVPAATDVNGDPGFDQAVLKTYIDVRTAALAWHARGDELEASAQALELAHTVCSLDADVRAWFELQRIALVDAQQALAVARGPEVTAPARDADAVRALWSHRSLAVITSDGASVLRWDALYPSPDQSRLFGLRDKLFAPNLGDAVVDGITEAQWIEAHGLASALVKWDHDRQGLAGLAVAREELLATDSEVVDELRVQCQRDLELADEIAAIKDLERLLVYQRDLIGFANNFISIADFFAIDQKAWFEYGTLYLSGRELHCSLPVSDRKSHAKLAASSGICTAYIKVESGPLKNREFAVPVTSGDAEGINAGRRGVFRAIEGDLAPATVTQVVENPVSMQDALLSPFGRIAEFMSKRFKQWTERSEKELDKGLNQIGDGSVPGQAAAATPAQAGPSNMLVGGSVAFAALGSSFAFITDTFKDLQVSTILLSLVGLILMVTVPTGIAAAIRLYHRNLAGLLEASGWAVNDRMRLTLELARIFTRTPAWPEHTAIDWSDELRSMVEKVDPGFLRSRRRVRRVLLLALVSAGVLVVGALLASVSVIAGLIIGIIGVGIFLLAILDGLREVQNGLSSLIGLGALGIVNVMALLWFIQRLGIGL